MIRRALAYTALVFAVGFILQLAFSADSILSSQSHSWDGAYEFVDGQVIGDGAWRCLWLGYGSGAVADPNLWLRPAVSSRDDETHSALVRSEFSLGSSWDFSVIVSTDGQLRTRKPNPWEVAWIMGDLTEDGSAGIYFTLKTNGVELGAYRDHGLEQHYLFTSDSPTLVLGSEYDYRLVKDSGRVYAFVNGSLIAEAPVDSIEHWNLGDRIGLYTEDAAVHFGEVRVESASSSLLSVNIINPDDGWVYDSGAWVSFEGIAGGRAEDLSETIQWTSNIDGPLGIGNQLLVQLSDGTHQISASVTNPSGQPASDSITVTVEPSSPGTHVARVSSISYRTAGGRRSGKHLEVTLSVQDEDAKPIANANVGVDLYLNGIRLMSGTALTDLTGTGSLRLKNAPSGCYSSMITFLQAAGLEWDSSNPPNSFCK